MIVQQYKQLSKAAEDLGTPVDATTLLFFVPQQPNNRFAPPSNRSRVGNYMSDPGATPGLTELPTYLHSPFRGFPPPYVNRSAISSPNPSGSLPPDTPESPFAGLFAPIVDRDPDAPKRSRAHMEIVQTILNSLIGRGEVVMIQDGLWRLFPNIATRALRAPDANDDVNDMIPVGRMWINTATNQFWICTDNASGAAVWNGPY